MGKNRNKNQPQGNNMSVNDQQEDQSQQASNAAVVTSATTIAPVDTATNSIATNNGPGDDDSQQGSDADKGDDDQSKEDAASDGTEEDKASDSSAPAVIDLGVQIVGNTGTTVVADNSVSVVKDVVQTEAKPTEAAVTDIGASVSDNTDLTKLLNQLQETGTVQQKTLVVNLKKYMEDMLPGKPTAAAQGAMHQMRLWEILRGVVENPDPAEFRKQMFIVRAFFKRYAGEKTAFSDHYINRFAESWTRSPQQLAALQRLINIFQLTADPLTTTEKLKSVDLSRSLTFHFSEQHRQRVLSYFQQ